MSNEASAAEYQSYSERPEWSDITPIPQHDDSFKALVPIFYAAEYKDATDYFRAIVKKDEKSERALELTEHIIRLNQSHYSAWQYRYNTLIALKSDLNVELALMNKLTGKFLKSYQIWHHRRLLITHLRKPGPELPFITAALGEDAKNYHTWAYRQWILAEFNEDDLWSGELEFIDRMLREDVRNNSAWHHRFFVVWASGVRKGEEDRDLVRRQEIDYAMSKISLAPNNASVWNYLRGLLKHTSTSFSTLTTFVIPYSLPHPATLETAPKVPQVEEENQIVVEDLENPLPSKQASLPTPYAIEFMAEIWEERGGEEGIAKATELYSSLSDKHDTMRKKYWHFRKREALQRRPAAATPPSAT